MLDERFWSKVEKTDGCWLWTRGLSRGYGTYSVGQRDLKAHVYLWECINGPKLFGMQLDHTCHTGDPGCSGGVTCIHRRCVNPDHLELVTPGTNTRRGLSPSGIASRVTACQYGHPLTQRGDQRRCPTCIEAKAAERVVCESCGADLRQGSVRRHNRLKHQKENAA